MLLKSLEIVLLKTDWGIYGGILASIFLWYPALWRILLFCTSVNFLSLGIIGQNEFYFVWQLGFIIFETEFSVINKLLPVILDSKISLKVKITK